MATEDLSLLFRYQGNVEELKQQLIHTTYELQLARIQANEEIRKNRASMENMKQLLRLLEMAHNERDQARSQIQKLLTKFNSATAAAKPLPVLSPSSGVTESLNTGDSPYDVVSPAPANTDPESLIIYNLAQARPLPQKGRLLQAVMEAGPLLQTLMVAGPLPRWRNPPQPQATPVNIVRFDGNSPAAGYANVPCGSAQAVADSVLDFAGAGEFGAAGLSLSNTGAMGSSFGMGFCRQVVPTPKRHRIQ